MGIVASLDQAGRPAWIGLMVLGFIFCWPVGLATLAFLIGSGRMSCWHQRGEYAGARDWQGRMAERRARWERRWAGRGGEGGGSGNRAFDEYRAETLRRLEDEEREFRDYLDKLRFARDKEEFDRFLAERRPAAPEAPHQA